LASLSPHCMAAALRLARWRTRAFGPVASILAAFAWAGCGGGGSGGSGPTAAGSPSPSASGTPTTVASCPSQNPAIALYSDVRRSGFAQNPDPSTLGILGECVIRTLWFNTATRWTPEDRPIAEQVLEAGRNPGLGVRSLHAQGITGRGVNVAIIDQNMQLDHPELAGKVVLYYDTGCGTPLDSGSMHGPAVTSLLVGETVGTAPGARVYYAAAPSWKQDAQYYANGLDWIVDENARMPAAARIRAVSVSAAPSGAGSPFLTNNAAWDQAVARAEAAGMLVLDCTSHHGFIAPGYYDPARREDVLYFRPGFPRDPGSSCGSGLYAPTSFRTQAEEYQRGEHGYQHTGQGGLSWAIPYVTGVLAMGWQLRPELSAATMRSILLATAHQDRNGCRVIDPPAFINGVRGAS
jgi:serine protease AprX